MAYTSGTETSDASATATLVARIETALTAHSAWEYVEEVTAGSYTVRVWRNKGADNGFGSDWYLALMRTSDTSDLRFLVSEGWDGSLAYRACVNPGSQSYIETTYRSLTGDTGYAWSDGRWNPYLTLATNTSSFAWRIHVNNKRVIVQTSISGSLQGIKYLGLFDKVEPFSSATWNSYNFPLVAVPLDLTGYDTDGSGSSTRRPMAPGNVSDAYAIRTDGQVFVNSFVGTLGTLTEHSYVGSKIYVQHSSADNTTGYHRGIYSEVLSFYGTAPANSGGDSITVGGNSWISFGVVGNYSYWMPND